MQYHNASEAKHYKSMFAQVYPLPILKFYKLCNKERILWCDLFIISYNGLANMAPSVRWHSYDKHWGIHLPERLNSAVDSIRQEWKLWSLINNVIIWLNL